MYTRRWKGYTFKQVSERMAIVASRRFVDKSKAERKAFSRAGVEARGSWEIINGKKIYVWKRK